MTQQRKSLLIYSACFLAVFLIIDFKNYISNGAVFIVTGDIIDQFKHYATLPGTILAFIVLIVVYQNIHNYDFVVLEGITLISSSILYGWIVSVIKNRYKTIA